jgi:hypothetical protein
MTLHDKVLDAEAREEQRQRQPDEAAADDQNRDLLVGFDRARPYRDRARPLSCAGAPRQDLEETTLLLLQR